jgi:hypothetical protein
LRFAGLTVGLLAMLLIGIGFALPGWLLLAVAVIVGLRAGHWLSLAGRSRVGRRLGCGTQRPRETSSIALTISPDSTVARERSESIIEELPAADRREGRTIKPALGAGPGFRAQTGTPVVGEGDARRNTQAGLGLAVLCRSERG